VALSHSRGFESGVAVATKRRDVGFEESLESSRIILMGIELPDLVARVVADLNPVKGDFAQLKVEARSAGGHLKNMSRKPTITFQPVSG
jgi:hypothetical protein